MDEEKLPTESEDVIDNGQAIQPQNENKPPRKWEVYEQILRIPYYVVFSRYTNRLRAFKLESLIQRLRASGIDPETFLNS